MEKSYRKELDQAYVLFKGEGVAAASYSIQVLVNHLIEGILPCSLNVMDQKMVWSCNHTGKVSLKDYCIKKNINEDELRWIGAGLIHNIQEVEDYLLEGEGILLDPEDIYLDLNEKKVLNCYVPFYREDLLRGMQNLSRFFLSHLDQNDPTAIQLGYQLFHCMNQEQVEIENIKRTLFNTSKNKDVASVETMGNVELIETAESMEDVKKRELKKPKWSFSKLIMCVIPFVIGGFLGIFLLWNEWYLSSAVKILLACAVVLSGVIGIIFVGKWGKQLQKENPVEASEDDEIPYLEQTGEIYLEESEKVWGKLIERESGKELVLFDNPSIVGKLPDVVQIRLESPFVSRIHAKIEMKEGLIYVEDLNSKNGTYVNREKIEPQKPVRVNP